MLQVMTCDTLEGSFSVIFRASKLRVFVAGCLPLAWLACTGFRVFGPPQYSGWSRKETVSPVLGPLAAISEQSQLQVYDQHVESASRTRATADLHEAERFGAERFRPSRFVNLMRLLDIYGVWSLWSPVIKASGNWHGYPLR